CNREFVSAFIKLTIIPLLLLHNLQVELLEWTGSFIWEMLVYMLSLNKRD
ncbi:unnamed protein product, partial [marine sediment metagenome]